ncbi:2-dehydropantoate 2-reductase [Pararhodobacter zhoushanensis]|uniref:2-dehydropantoate 2-reductase n=1 Tax=Pararhodobacter zhoushanensis TaxID=2479545 RepID=A0ABT3GW41_9RHOB|nr:2-dehydropantoate 2-reductase [Pararhodobacter zhoushanensis]MCW1931761.1 2-dehydropantoate 2-reductase [Pararhodobacter zhoushanensis]
MRIAVFGAGAVGCYIGGRLAAAGGDVVLIGRARIGAELAQGLVLSDYRGGSVRCDPLPFAQGAEGAAGAGLVLVCVKSPGSEAAARALRPHLATGAQVISFQNGIRNAGVLADGLERPVLAGMVGFNVAAQGEGRFHQGTQGDLHVEATPGLPLDLFARAGLPLKTHADIGPVLWAKLMLNLNNAINALSGIPLRDQLAQRDFRRCLALAQSELLALCAQAGQPLAKLSPLPAAWIPSVLRLPDPMFRAIAGSMLRIDPLARSSMADDLALGRAPELDAINGEVGRLATQMCREAPVNACLTALVRDAAVTPRRWEATELLRAITAA